MSLPLELLEHLVDYLLAVDVVRLRAARAGTIPDLLWPSVTDRVRGAAAQQTPTIPLLNSSRHALSLRFPRQHEAMFHLRCQYHACSSNQRVPDHYRAFILRYLCARDKRLRGDEHAAAERKSKERAEQREFRQQSMATDRERRRNDRSSTSLIRDCKNTVRRHALPPSDRG